jgi:hypothetical protein
MTPGVKSQKPEEGGWRFEKLSFGVTPYYAKAVQKAKASR